MNFGGMTTDFMRINLGLFHQSNGGFLVIQATDLLTNPQAFEAVKRTLKTRQITIEGMKDQLGMVTMSGLRPEPIPVNVNLSSSAAQKSTNCCTAWIGISKNSSRSSRL
jgi:predicted ATP-dependent protease